MRIKRRVGYNALVAELGLRAWFCNADGTQLLGEAVVSDGRISGQLETNAICWSAIRVFWSGVRRDLSVPPLCSFSHSTGRLGVFHCDLIVAFDDLSSLK
jgi:hypothetical protein